jgi:thioredoxin 1
MQLRLFIPILLLMTLQLTACGSGSSSHTSTVQHPDSLVKVTFIELGSTTCIPCKKMQPIMKSVETRYAGQVKVIFHDVMKDRSKSKEYNINLIPTQIFLDKSGKEIARHEGFYPEEEIDKLLQAQGLTPKAG